jgi:hypothetical protein
LIFAAVDIQPPPRFICVKGKLVTPHSVKMSFGGFQAQQSQSTQIDESTPWVAAGDGDLPLLQSSIAQLNLSPNAADSNGFTFLHAACGYGRIKVIQWLLGLNADSIVIDVNAKDGDGDTPLHHCDDVDTAKILIEAGADTTIKNCDGKTALEVKQEDLDEGDDEDDSDDEDRSKLKELVEFLTIQRDGIVE